jgi:Domain of unknown function (DUF4091)
MLKLNPTFLRVALCVSFFLSLNLFESLVVQAGPIVWTAPQLTRVGREDTPPAGAPTNTVLYAARGEYESFQIIIRGSATGLNTVRIAASSLADANKHQIPKTNITLFREHYVHIVQSSPDRGGTNRPLGPGWYPDALIPLPADADKKTSPPSPTQTASPFDVAANTNQPIWVDIFVPRKTDPGTYRGTITIASDQGQSTVPITLNVWNFELPLRPSLRSSFTIYNDTASSPRVFYGDSVANQRLLLEHKLMPVYIDPSAEREFLDKYGLNFVQLDFFKVATYGNCKQPPPPSLDELAALKAKHQPDAPLYVHIGDEINECREIFPALKKWTKNLRAAGITPALTAIPITDLRDDGSGTGHSVADVWAMLPKQIVSNSADMAAAMKKGDQVWSYTALVQDAYSPKWAIDFAPINYRILGGFLNQVQGLTGLLYWTVNSWTVNPTSDPWDNVSYIENGKPTPPGEGWLVYPGEKIGSNQLVPSIRLKWIRKSVEDYEYIEMLKHLGRGDWALQIARNVAPDWTNWTRDPNALESARKQFGDEISRITSSQPPVTHR